MIPVLYSALRFQFSHRPRFRRCLQRRNFLSGINIATIIAHDCKFQSSPWNNSDSGFSVEFANGRQRKSSFVEAFIARRHLNNPLWFMRKTFQKVARSPWHDHAADFPRKWWTRKTGNRRPSRLRTVLLVSNQVSFHENRMYLNVTLDIRSDRRLKAKLLLALGNLNFRVQLTILVEDFTQLGRTIAAIALNFLSFKLYTDILHHFARFSSSKILISNVKRVKMHVGSFGIFRLSGNF